MIRPVNISLGELSSTLVQHWLELGAMLEFCSYEVEVIPRFEVCCLIEVDVIPRFEMSWLIEVDVIPRFEVRCLIEVAIRKRSGSILRSDS